MMDPQESMRKAELTKLKKTGIETLRTQLSEHFDAETIAALSKEDIIHELMAIKGYETSRLQAKPKAEEGAVGGAGGGTVEKLEVRPGMTTEMMILQMMQQMRIDAENKEKQHERERIAREKQQEADRIAREKQQEADRIA